MIVSEARRAASISNGSRSKGPVSPEGREISRKNALKHGLTGAGIVTPEGDAEEVARRVEALTDDMKPRSQAGVILILQMATLSVRSERAARQESAAIARNVRHAADAFDEGRIERAGRLFEALADDPRGNLRKLRKMPEGVERLIEGWYDLRNDLTADPEPIWAAAQLEQAANLTGLKSQHARGSRLGALSRGFWGDSAALGEADGGGLDEASRREWAQAGLIEHIDAEILALEAHYETLDFEIVDLDRAEAGQRALFDDSKPAILARRYESEASRGFFKCLKEFRKVEAEFTAQAEASPSRPAPPRPEPSLGSFRETAPPPDREPSRTLPDAPSAADSVARGPEGQPIRANSPTKTPG